MAQDHQRAVGSALRNNSEDVVRRGLRIRPPTHMTEGGYTGFSRWDPFTESRVDRAVSRTRQATFGYFGLDPDDPRD